MKNARHPLGTPDFVGARVVLFLRQWTAKHSLGAILLLALVVGMLLFLIIPPWWHYDEPGHFEYAWLAAHSPAWPIPGQYDQSTRREMAASMLRYNWYAIRNIKPDLKGAVPIPIGVTQAGDKPGYYFLASLPLRLIPHADITVQYYAARLVSFLLYLLIVAVAWFSFGEIMPRESPLRWITTAFIAVLPAFVDSMVSVNNDVAAVLAASLALWACLHLIQRGYSVVNILFLGLSLVACYLSKSTAMYMFGLVPVALVLALLHGRYQLAVWGGGVLLVVGLAAVSIAWGCPRSWYTGAAGSDSTRARTANSPLGAYAFRFDDSTPSAASQMLQIMTPDEIESLRGKTVTMGTWIWASQPTQAGPIFVSFARHSGDIVSSPQLTAQATTQPIFHAIAFSVPADTVSATVYVQQASHSLPHNYVYFDGLVLAPGQFGEASPAFADSNGLHGTWAGQSFTNALRNPSAEQGSFQIRQSVDARTSRILGNAGLSLPAALTMIQDWAGSGWYYRDAVDTLFRTFWASLAGDKVVVSTFINDVLVLLTAAGVAGAFLCLWLRRAVLRWDLVGFLGIALLVPWALAFLRGGGDFMGGSPLYPWARYAFPAILPTALFLCAGWLQWLDRIRGLTDATRKTIVLVVMLAVYAVAVSNAARVFHPARGLVLSFLVLLTLFLYIVFNVVASRWPQPRA